MSSLLVYPIEVICEVSSSVCILYVKKVGWGSPAPGHVSANAELGFGHRLLDRCYSISFVENPVQWQGEEWCPQDSGRLEVEGRRVAQRALARRPRF